MPLSNKRFLILVIILNDCLYVCQLHTGCGLQCARWMTRPSIGLVLQPPPTETATRAVFHRSPPRVSPKRPSPPPHCEGTFDCTNGLAQASSLDSTPSSQHPPEGQPVFKHSTPLTPSPCPPRPKLTAVSVLFN